MWWLIGAAVVIALILWLRRNTAGDWHPSDSRYLRQGIDVPHHQGRIDRSRLPDAEVDFAYIKACEGGDYRDPEFA